MAHLWSFRHVLCALMLLGLTGCEEEPPPVCGVVPAPPGAGLRLGLLKAGERVILSIPPVAAQTCLEEPFPTSITAEIEGPGGEPVAHEAQLGAQGQPALLEFTPVRPGRYHILVSFSQMGGLHQLDLHAVVDSTRTAPSHTLPRTCASLERTLQGAWVCDTEVHRGDTLVRSFPASRLAVAGDVLWEVSGTQVRRFVDTGTDLVMTGSMGHSQGGNSFLLASADELAVVHDSSLALYTFSNGTLSSAGPEAWSRPSVPVSSPGPSGVLLREGNQLALVTFASNQNGPRVQVCPYQLAAGKLQRTPASCSHVTGDTVGFEPTVLWTRDPPQAVGNRLEQGTIHRWEWTGGQLVARSTAALGEHARVVFPPLTSNAHAPVIYSEPSSNFPRSIWAVALWSAERQEILFEHLDAEVVEMRASPHFYWGRTSYEPFDRTTKIRIRSQAPVP
jgi:hypothetical protein